MCSWSSSRTSLLRNHFRLVLGMLSLTCVFNTCLLTTRHFSICLLYSFGMCSVLSVLLLMLLFCLCGAGGAGAGGNFKHIPFDTKEQLIAYHTEAQGEDKVLEVNPNKKCTSVSCRSSNKPFSQRHRPLQGAEKSSDSRALVHKWSRPIMNK